MSPPKFWGCGLTVFFVIIILAALLLDSGSNFLCTIGNEKFSQINARRARFCDCNG